MDYCHVEPRELVQKWVDAFNRADPDALSALYSDDATNHQVAEQPVVGRENIRKMFDDGFRTAGMTCIAEKIFQDGDWAILEWRDPLGLRGCGFFHVVDDKIAFQRATGTSSHSFGSRDCRYLAIRIEIAD